MSMVTRCPSCNTAFRVTPRELQAHGGQVRCGRCLTVFDGFSTLEALAVPPAPAPAAPPPPASAFELPPPATEPPPTARTKEREGAAPPPPLVLGEALFAEPPPHRARGARWWAAGSVLLLFVLAGQVALFYRSELAARYPPLRPYLVRACELLECTVALPQRPRQIAIEASDLQALDPARPGLIRLTATLRNHAGYDLGYPALDLVLTDARDHTLARRIFLPAEYLGTSRDALAGIPAHAEVTIRLELDAGELAPAGFRLDLLPAPLP
jgi:predicted Zn finger-like uncharacterized protein